MAIHRVRVKQFPPTDVQHSPLEVEIRRDGKLHGVLIITQGHIAWRPPQRGAISLTWQRFGEIMRGV